jgi:hypothetical protein
VHGSAPLGGASLRYVVIVFMVLRPRISHPIAFSCSHNAYLPVHLRLRVSQENQSRRSIFGQRVLDQKWRTTSRKKQAIGAPLFYDHLVWHTCIMHINCHFDALLFFTPGPPRSWMQRRCRPSQCSTGAPTEFRYWSRGVCWKGQWVRYA